MATWLMLGKATHYSQENFNNPESIKNFPDHCLTYIDLVEDPKVINGTTYDRWKIVGSGPQWKKKHNVGYISVPQGEDINIAYRNFLPTQTLIHAHGQTPPSNLDGVPYLSAIPLQPNRTQLYSYRLRPQNVGTYFIHSHYSFQHERGLAAPVVIHGQIPSEYPNAATYNKANDVIFYLEDFCAWATDAGESQNMQCIDSASVYETLVEGWNDESATWNFSDCMDPGTDSDVNYRYHLANYRTLDDPVNVFVTPGETIRLRIVSSTGMTNYWIDLVELQGTLIMTDGQYCKPYTNKTFWIGVAQRLDIMITIPSSATDKTIYPIFAYAEKADARSGIVLVVGDQKTNQTWPIQTGDIAGFMSEDIWRVYADKKIEAWFPLLTKEANRNFTVNLTGDNGFHGINGVSYQLPPQGPANPFKANPNALTVKAGERVCIKFINFNADAHAMHLHGHSFQVVEMNGIKLQNGPMRDVVMSPKGNCDTVTFCFNANNPGVWPLHCHMNYHLAAGMLTTVEYQLERSYNKGEFGNNCTAPDPTPGIHIECNCPSWAIGVVGGIGILLFFIGILIGTCCCPSKRRNNSVNSFSKLDS